MQYVTAGYKLHLNMCPIGSGLIFLYGGRGLNLPKIITPSIAELMERIRRKTQDKFIVLHPAVGEQIAHLKDAKRWQANRHGDEDYKTVIHADITHALRKGIGIEAEELVNGAGWSITVHGVSTDGNKLSISVNLMKDNGDPLVIMSFSLLPDETEIDE